MGTWPTTQARALTGNRTCDLLVCRLALNPLSCTSQCNMYKVFHGHVFLFFSLLLVVPIEHGCPLDLGLQYMTNQDFCTTFVFPISLISNSSITFKKTSVITFLRQSKLIAFCHCSQNQIPSTEVLRFSLIWFLNSKLTYKYFIYSVQIYTGTHPTTSLFWISLFQFHRAFCSLN